MTEQQLLATVRSVVDDVVAAGRPMPVSWIVQEIIARHVPAGWQHPNRELIEYGCRQTLERMVRSCLGLPNDGATEDQPIYSATDLPTHAATLDRHADELLRFARDRNGAG